MDSLNKKLSFLFRKAKKYFVRYLQAAVKIIGIESFLDEAELEDGMDSFIETAEDLGMMFEDSTFTEICRFILKNWMIFISVKNLPDSVRKKMEDLAAVSLKAASRSNIGGAEYRQSLNNLKDVLKAFDADSSFLETLEDEIENCLDFEEDEIGETVKVSSLQADGSDLNELPPLSKVRLRARPSQVGMIVSSRLSRGSRIYTVFLNGENRDFTEDQIELVPEETIKYIGAVQVRAYLTAYQICHPTNNLYSLNTGKFDFNAYQFRPALKMIHSPDNRLLIADSVGVGKTIEAGIILQELKARTSMDKVLIICPRPLVAEKKWESEMKNRFDEEFTPLDGRKFRELITDTEYDEQWPVKYNKCIIPYSIMDSKAYEGDGKSYGCPGLSHLHTEPHFNLVIVDEAHTIRNGSLEKEKAFAYKCTRYFCERADAVIMLTATPLQTEDKNLFTLLNVLAPDVVIDEEVFATMSRPNPNITSAASCIRGGKEGWQQKALKQLNGVKATGWGKSVTAKNPVYSDVLQRLEKENISREERIELLEDVESLHSFSTLINRTRRRDISKFCVRRPMTVEVSFTPSQQKLYDAVVEFESTAMAILHDSNGITFMTTTIKRMAASCIYALRPGIRDLVNKRLQEVMADDGAFDEMEFEVSMKMQEKLNQLSDELLCLSKELDSYDPKLEKLREVLDAKEKLDNNKVMIFSSFRHTLHYLRNRLQDSYRIGQVDGSVSDEERQILKKRFELDKSDPDALDILLFTEVGSEGLDYQFCNMMINYDLPWNPMRIEQRIGRIDRKGQKSEFVTIVNIVTKGTIDYDIYQRCYMRIGIFEKSIGDCDAILGDFTVNIRKIAESTELSDEEKRMKLEQIADNEIRQEKELAKLEEQEEDLFGFNISELSTAKEIQRSENRWMAPENLEFLVSEFWKDTFDGKRFLYGTKPVHNVKISKSVKNELLNFLKNNPDVSCPKTTQWYKFLCNPKKSNIAVTFYPEAVKDLEQNVVLVNAVHPLVIQAARSFDQKKMDALANLVVYSDKAEEGIYYFGVYDWQYSGERVKSVLKYICLEDAIGEDLLMELLLQAGTNDFSSDVIRNEWESLEDKQFQMLQTERSDYIKKEQSRVIYQQESIRNNYENQQRSVRSRMDKVRDDKIRRMYEGMLERNTEKFNNKTAELEKKKDNIDLYSKRIIRGILEVKK